MHVYRGTNLYLIGFCHLRQAIRWFRVDKIKKLEILQEHFEPDPKFNAKEYMASVFQHEVGDKLLSVEIWFDAKTAPYIEERRWHFTQEIEKHSGRDCQEHPEWVRTLLQAIAQLNGVAGGHARANL